MKKALKQSLSVILSILMIVSTWAFAPVASAADVSIGNNTAAHVVPDYQSYNATLKEAYLGGYAEPLDGTNGNPDMIIPGLNSADDMVPQGLAYYPEKNWVLTTSYIGSNSTHTNTTSVIYALDFTTGEYVAKFNLYNKSGSAFTAHAGGLGVSDNNLYICDSGSTVSYVSLDKLSAAANGSETSLYLEGTVDIGSANNSSGTSYLSIEDGILWTGNFYQSTSDAYNTAANSNYNSLVLGYDLNGYDNSADEWAAFTALSDSGSATPSYVIAVPDSIYDIQSLVVSENNIYIGTSWGRTNNSHLYIGRVNLDKAGTVALTLANGKKVNAYEINNAVSYIHLPMCEGMFMYKDSTGHKYIYNGFESAAYYYYGYSTSVCKYPTDVVWKIDADALYSNYVANATAGASNTPDNTDSGLAVELVASTNDEPLTRVLKEDTNKKIGYVYYASYDNEGNLVTDDSYYAQDYFYLRASNHSTGDITITHLETNSSEIYIGEGENITGTTSSKDVSITVPAGETVYFKVSGADSVSAIANGSVSVTYTMDSLPAAGTTATGSYTATAHYRLLASVVGNTTNYARYYNNNSSYTLLALAGRNTNATGNCMVFPIWTSSVTYDSPSDISLSMDKNNSTQYINTNYTTSFSTSNLSTSIADYDSSGTTSGPTTDVKEASIYYNVNTAKYKNLLTAGIIWNIGVWGVATNQTGSQYIVNNVWTATSSDAATYGTVKTTDILTQYPLMRAQTTGDYSDANAPSSSTGEPATGFKATATTTDTYIKSNTDLSKNPGLYTVTNEVQAWHDASRRATHVFGEISVTINAYNASALATLVHKCENTAFVSEKYDSSLWTAYQSALSTAMNRVGAYGQAQSAMDSAYTELETAYNALVNEDVSTYAAEVYEVSHNLYTGKSATGTADDTVKKYYLVAAGDSFTPSYIDDSTQSGYSLSLANKINARDTLTPITSTITKNDVTAVGINYYATAYTVTFANDDGTVLQSGNVYYGETPAYTGATPTKSADSYNHYTFNGWNTAIAPVESNVTYTAKYSSEAHTVVTDAEVKATCTTAGKTEGSHCSVCGEILVAQTEVPALGHNFAGAAVSNNDGTHSYKCTNNDCTAVGAVIDGVQVENGKVACSGGTATCIDKAVCEECNTAYGEYGAHQLAATPAKAPTCTEAGNDAYWTCSVCSKVFSDAAGTTVIADKNGDGEQNADDAVIPATGHTPVSADNGVAATCTEDGKEADTVCAVCGETLEVGAVIPATGHTPVSADNAESATCTTDGKEADTVCSVCGETLEEGAVIPATGHTPVSADNAVDPTCTTDGKEADTVCSVCGETLEEGAVIPATGHTPGEWIIDENSDCTNGGSKHQVCSVCSATIATEEIPPAGHTWDSGTVTPPTCTADGYTTYTCTVCGATKTEGYVDKTGHTPAEAVVENEVDSTCSTEGSYDSVVYCSVCGEELSRTTETIAKKDHTPAEAVEENVVDSTCAVEGSYDSVVYCSVCGEELSRTTETIAKKDHTPAEAVEENVVDSTCAVEGSYDSVVYCSVCGEKLSRTTETIAKKDHTPAEAVEENVVDSTCSTEGSYDSVVYCSVCGEELSRTTETIAKKDHTPVSANNAVAATCTTDGKEADTVCEVCGITLEEGAVIPATGHTPVSADNGVAATCTTDGKEADTICDVCGETLEVGAVIPATGHTPVSADNAVAATCTEDGKEADTVCSVCGETLEEGAVIPATGHTPGEWIIDENSDCTNGGSKHQVCAVCGATIATEEIPANGHSYVETVTPPTCTTEGYTTHTCEVCGDSYIDTIVPATGHTPVSADNAVAATCTTDGKEADTVCSVCGETLEVGAVIPATGHTPVSADNAVAATCTEDGKESDTVCSVCGITLEEGAVIPATGHTPVSADNAVAATCTTDGKEADTVCEVCGITLEEGAVIPATGHTPADAVRENVVESTCSVEGSYDSVVYCLVCGAELSRTPEIIAKKAHTPVSADNAVAATCTTDGKESDTVCAVCGITLEVGAVIPATGHTPVTDAAVPATCETAGKTEGSHCSVCGEILVAQTEVPALGHDFDYDNGVLTRPTVADGAWVDGYYTYTCTRDASHTTTKPAPRADYTEYEKAVADINSAIASGILNQDAIDALNEALTDNAVAKDLIDTEQAKVDNAAKALKDALNADAGSLKPDFTEIDKALDEYDDADAVVDVPTDVADRIDEIKDIINGIKNDPSANRADKQDGIDALAQEVNGYVIHLAECAKGNHEFSSEWTIDIEATCIQTGSKSHHCAYCLATTAKPEFDGDHIDIPMLDHNVTDWTITKEATCIEAGEKIGTCTVCGITVTEEITKLGHDWSAWVQIKAPACLENGAETRTCDRCGETQTRDIAKTGHHVVIIPAVEATCEKEGSTEGQYCDVCGTVLVAPETVPVKDHVDADGDGVCDECGAEIAAGSDGCICHKGNIFSKIVRWFCTLLTKIFHKKITCCDDMEFWGGELSDIS